MSQSVLKRVGEDCPFRADRAPLSALSPGELADYRFARKSGLSRDEALSAAGRRDLTGQIAANRRRAAAARATRAAAREERV
ncbi:hypothetical protein [uncultured Zoogloea sp.]|uniref:hypothetical protein n=1 Tax=uncultured Zoogloea sp. TaxID=160237 RepID=UPI00262657F5|nr:hypothetical protein [uncultured Zoogloea sp.]